MFVNGKYMIMKYPADKLYCVYKHSNVYNPSTISLVNKPDILMLPVLVNGIQGVGFNAHTPWSSLRSSVPMAVTAWHHMEAATEMAATEAGDPHHFILTEDIMTPQVGSTHMETTNYRPHCDGLIHLPLVPHVCVSELGMHWFR